MSAQRLTVTNTDELDRRIEERLAAQQERLSVQHRQMVERMHELGRRQRHYLAAADRLAEEVVRPRLEKLARRFENAELLSPDVTGRHQCVCSFRRTSRYPATAKLELGVSRNGEIDQLLVLYSPSILPAFFEFAGRDQLALPLEQVDEGRVAGWVEEKILRFLDAYLRLETLGQYQAENFVTDPVCGVRFNRLSAAAQVEYRGETHYFCASQCQQQFTAAPENHHSTPASSGALI
jgi:YHS domain-containing protein